MLRINSTGPAADAPGHIVANMESTITVWTQKNYGRIILIAQWFQFLVTTIFQLIEHKFMLHGFLEVQQNNTHALNRLTILITGLIHYTQFSARGFFWSRFTFCSNALHLTVCDRNCPHTRFSILSRVRYVLICYTMKLRRPTKLTHYASENPTHEVRIYVVGHYAITLLAAFRLWLGLRSRHNFLTTQMVTIYVYGMYVQSRWSCTYTIYELCRIRPWTAWDFWTTTGFHFIAIRLWTPAFFNWLLLLLYAYIVLN